MAAADEGCTSITWHMAREARSMMSGLCSLRRSCTSRGTKTSTERALSDSSVPMLSNSHNSLNATTWRPSSSDFMPARMVLRRECEADTEGSKSSSPAPNLRSKPCSAWLGPPHCLASLSSNISSAACSSSRCCRCSALVLLPASAGSLGLVSPPFAAAAWSEAFCSDIFCFRLCLLDVVAARCRFGGARRTASCSRGDRLLRVVTLDFSADTDLVDRLSTH
mmetsp:Transcript_3764/g.7296  ORF Transcript_3764/g.7296 Transcript_3764/m.7296 type:complete len:222 (-) Transcript_3764:5-670(-)